MSSGFPPPGPSGPRLPAGVTGQSHERTVIILLQVLVVLLFAVVVMLGLWMAGLVHPTVEVRVG